MTETGKIQGAKCLIVALAFGFALSASATTYYLRHSEGGSSADAWPEVRARQGGGSCFCASTSSAI